MADASPTVRQRELGKRLKDLRSECGFTIEDVAEKLICSTTKISRLENWARRPSLRDVRDLCDIYGVEDSVKTELMDLARKAREQGWWTQYEDLNLEPYIGLEQEAISITCYSMYYVPALLQTEEYAGEIIRTIAPQMDPAVQQQRVEARMRRQQRLEEEKRPRYRVLIDEAVLHRQVGGVAPMIVQLDKILKAEYEAKATVQVIPFAGGAHAAQDSNFVFLEFEEESNLSPVVFVEGLTGGHVLERRSDIIRYREAIEHLRDAALNPRDSVRQIASIRDKYAST